MAEGATVICGPRAVCLVISRHSASREGATVISGCAGLDSLNRRF
jgi:hypothetical protein